MYFNIMQEKILETQVEYIDVKNSEFCFLKELFDIMYKYNIHRIYRICNKDGDEFYEAHQALEAQVIRNNLILTKLVLFLKNHIPYIYYKVFLNIRLRRFKKALKKFSDNHNIELVSTNSFSICQGIYISDNQICINGVDFIYKNGRICHFDKLYLEI